MNIKRQEEQVEAKRNQEMQQQQQKALIAAQGNKVAHPTSNDLTIQMGDKKVLIPNITEQGEE